MYLPDSSADGLRDSEVEPVDRGGNERICSCHFCLSGGVIVPTIAAGVTSATASALTAGKSSKGEPLSVTADTVVHKAPDNLFTMLGNLISVGGIGLILFLAATYLIPLLMGYLIPNGFERKKKSKK